MRAFFLCLIFIFTPATMANESFEDFLKGVKAEITAKGINPVVMDELFGDNPQPNRFIIDRWRPRPPCICTPIPPAEKFKRNQKRYLSDTRLQKAKEALSDPDTLAVLQAVEDAYGVDKEAIVALWGIESYFGTNQGQHHIPHVLATLAWYPKERRNSFFRKELLIAIRIYAEGHVLSDKFRGSWAGAMGQVQFMPSTFMHYAVDFDGDGKKDIWNNEADAFASAANYLSSLGWQKGAHWKTPFVLDRPITKGIFYGTGLSKQRVFKRNSEGNIVYKKGKPVIVRYRVYRLQARVFKIRGVPVPSSVNMEDHVYLFLPYGNKSGLEGYLLHNNFHVILSWNYSSYFAFGILSIMDELKKHPVDV